MTRPAFIPGGEESLYDETLRFGESQGVFAGYPAATKKYIQNAGPRDAEYRESMARIFVQMTAKEKELFLTSVPPETRPLAEVLCGVATGSSGGTGFIDFLLTQVNESFTEKYQVMEALSDNFVVYVFGQGAPTFSYSGVLLNTWQDDQRVWMTRLYRDVLRGTQLARRKKLMRLRYDSVIVSGVMLNLNMQIIADQEDRVPFSFNFIPTQYAIYTEAVGTPTKLKTPFTPAGGLALDTAKAPDTTRLKVAARTTPPAQATRQRQNETNTSKLSIKPPTKAQDVPRAKINTPSTAKKSEPKNVRPGSSLTG